MTNEQVLSDYVVMCFNLRKLDTKSINKRWHNKALLGWAFSHCIGTIDEILALQLEKVLPLLLL